MHEADLYDEPGKLQHASVLDYRMPAACDLPLIDTILVEVPNPTQPVGVRGVGEVPLMPPLAAVANAVARAAGVHLYDLPISPPRPLAALDRAGSWTSPDDPVASPTAYTGRSSAGGRARSAG